MKSKNNNSNDIIKSKFPKLGFFFIGIIVMLVVSSLFVLFDYLPLSDPQLEPFERKYSVMFIEGMNTVRDSDGNIQSIGVSGVSDSILILDGEVKFDTTSRSARNPIDVTIKLIPMTSNFMGYPIGFEKLPNTLHFEFPDAKILNSDEEPIIELELTKGEEPYYIGHSKLFYEEKGEYDFFLQESKKYQDHFNYTKTETGFIIKTRIVQSEDPNDLGLRIMAYDETPNEKIKIEPYGQTIGKEGYKMGILIFFGGILFFVARKLLKISREFYFNKSVQS